MRVEISIDKTKKLPNGAVEALRNEFSKRLEKKFGEGVRLDIKLSSNDNLAVHGVKETKIKEEVSSLLQETWESADDWFNP